nr:hypothetical protein B0A51_01036 [Rachicladosporium sp. CCFEE 5018]
MLVSSKVTTSSVQAGYISPINVIIQASIDGQSNLIMSFTSSTVPYSTISTLNTLALHLPTTPPKPAQGIWLICIHGGAWCDPLITSTCFDATLKHLLSSSPASHISGIASLNYRLSPYPSHPTEPSSPHDPARNAKHPDHITDVLTAILFLQDKYKFGDRYILIGHSCGATLAFQVAKKRYWGKQFGSTEALELNVEPPFAIIGVEGIYDLPTFVEEYAHEPFYRGFVEHAFGRDEVVWKEASVVDVDWEDSWTEGREIVILHSDADKLVSLKQPERMWKALGEKGWKDDEGAERRKRFVKLKGLDHDEVWEDGKALAEVIGETIGRLT